MPSTWTEVEQNPGYQALSEQEKEAARKQYFDDVVAPQVPLPDQEAALGQFLSDTSPAPTTLPKPGVPLEKPLAPSIAPTPAPLPLAEEALERLGGAAAGTARELLKGATLGYVDLYDIAPPLAELEAKYLQPNIPIDPKDPIITKISKAFQRDPAILAKIPAGMLGALLPISKISRTISAIKGIPASVKAIIGQAALTGGIFGAAKKPEAPTLSLEGLGERVKSAATSAAFFAGATGATLGANKLIQNFRVGKLKSVQELRESMYKLFIDKKGLPRNPDTIKWTDDVLEEMSAARGGLNKINRWQINKAIKRVQQAAGAEVTAPPPPPRPTVPAKPPITPPQVAPVAPPAVTPAPPAPLPPPTGIQPSVAPPVAAVRAVVKPRFAVNLQKDRLTTFIRKMGGVDPADPLITDYREAAGKQPGLVRQQGVSLDRMREAAAEAGFIRPESTEAEFLDLIAQDKTNKNVFSVQRREAKLPEPEVPPGYVEPKYPVTEPINTGVADLKVGDKFTIKGEEHTVVSATENQVEIQNGKTLKVDPYFDQVPIDGGAQGITRAKPPAEVAGVPVTEGKLPVEERAALLERAGQGEAAKKLREAERGFTLVGKPKTGETLKSSLVKQAHIVAKDKGWVSKEGKVKPQYRRLAEAMTGKKSIAKMNPKQAQTFVDALKQVPAPEYVAGKTKIASIPLSKDITPAGFFERNFKEPTLISAITPSDRYAYTLGVNDLVEPSIKAKTAMLNERQGLHDWLDGMEKRTNKLAKTPLSEKAKARLKNIPTKAEERMGNFVDNYETAAEAGLTGEEAIIHTELRKLTNVSLARTNEIREAVGLEPIRKLSGYMTHISDILTNKALKEKYPFPEEIKYWLDRINPKHIFNPTALHRTVKERPGLEKNPFKALKAMVSMDLKQIYLETPNIMFRKQLNALAPQIPATTRKWAQLFQNEVIKGYPTRLDNLTNATLDRMGITRMIDAALKPFGRGLGANPAKDISGAINRLVHDAVIWGKVRLVIRNHTQKLLSLGLYDTKAFMKSMLPASPELESILKDSEWFKISGQQFMERLPEGMLGKLEKLGYKPYGHSHVSNVRSTMKAAYYASRELVDNPKYAKLGWTEADIKKEMEFGGNTAQYWYNLMGMPEIFRSGGGRFLATLQSWWMNYTTKYWREMLHRAYYGKTGWGKSIPVKWRMGALRHVITSLLFVEGTRRALGLDYKRIALLGVLPTYLSPPAQIVTGLYNYVTADSEWQKKKARRQIKWSWKAFVPGSGAWRDFSTVWKGEKPVESLFFYTEKKPPGRRKIGGIRTTVTYGP